MSNLARANRIVMYSFSITIHFVASYLMSALKLIDYSTKRRDCGVVYACRFVIVYI